MNKYMRYIYKCHAHWLDLSRNKQPNVFDEREYIISFDFLLESYFSVRKRMNGIKAKYKK